MVLLPACAHCGINVSELWPPFRLVFAVSTPWASRTSGHWAVRALKTTRSRDLAVRCPSPVTREIMWRRQVLAMAHDAHNLRRWLTTAGYQHSLTTMASR